jgi:hypothetical protein
VQQVTSSLGLFGSQQQSFNKSFQESILEAYRSPSKWTAASLDKLSGVTKDLSKEYIQAAQLHEDYASKALLEPVNDAIASESGFDIGRNISNMEIGIESEFRQVSGGLSKFSIFAKGTAIGLEVISKVDDVRIAQPGQRVRTAFVSGAELAGEISGSAVGEIIVAYTAPFTMGASMFIAPPITIGTAAIGGYALGHLASAMEEVYDDVNKFWSR